MIDKGEKIPFKERIEIKKIHTVGFFLNIKSKLKGKSVLIVCMALLVIMGALDIPCKIIHSTENGEHAWNIVQLNGEWYHVDVTFDGGTDEYEDYEFKE